MLHISYLPKALFSVMFVLQALPASADTAKERPDWALFFDQFNAMGTIVASDERVGSKGELVFENNRAKKRYTPASTFKIPHTLFALDAGVIHDEFATIAWDGTKKNSF